jgi:hypothetical protein
MKRLFNYKSQDTLGLVRGNARLNENAAFSDVLAKKKNYLVNLRISKTKLPLKVSEWDEKLHQKLKNISKVLYQLIKNSHQHPKKGESGWYEKSS